MEVITTINQVSSIKNHWPRIVFIGAIVWHQIIIDCQRALHSVCTCYMYLNLLQ